MLQLDWLLNEVTIHLHLVLHRIFVVRHQRRLLLVTIVVQAALTVGDTYTLDGDRGRKLCVLFTNEVVSFIERILDHAAHTGILVNVPQLWRRLQSSLISLCLLLLLVLGSELCLELGLLSLHLGEGLLLLLHLSLQLLVVSTACAAAATTASFGGTTRSEALDLLTKLSDELVLSRLINLRIVLDGLHLPSIA